MPPPKRKVSVILRNAFYRAAVAGAAAGTLTGSLRFAFAGASAGLLLSLLYSHLKSDIAPNLSSSSDARTNSEGLIEDLRNDGEAQNLGILEQVQSKKMVILRNAFYRASASGTIAGLASGDWRLAVLGAGVMSVLSCIYSFSRCDFGNESNDHFGRNDDDDDDRWDDDDDGLDLPPKGPLGGSPHFRDMSLEDSQNYEEALQRQLRKNPPVPAVNLEPESV